MVNSSRLEVSGRVWVTFQIQEFIDVVENAIQKSPSKPQEEFLKTIDAIAMQLDSKNSTVIFKG